MPTLYIVDEQLSVHFSCGVVPGGELDRLPARVERIVRNLFRTASTGDECPVGIDSDLVVRIADAYATAGRLRAVVIETLRTRDPLHEAIARFGITARETQVLRLLLLGASTAAIARRLSIAETTACDHVRSISAKTDAHTRGQIVARVLGFLG